MTRWVQVAFLALLLVSPCLGQISVNLDEIRQKTDLTDADCDRIRAYVTQAVQAMLTNTDPDRGGMVAARQGIVQEVEGGGAGRTEAYRQAFAEQAVAVLKEVDDKAVSQAARLNYVMVLARLQMIEAAPLLQSALEKDPYQASRYWAAKGLAMLGPKIRERVMPRLEAQISETIQKVFEAETSGIVLLQLFETLGQFDHEQAHDVLAEGFIRVAKTANLSDPVVSSLLLQAIRAMERAYEREVRPGTKQQLLFGYATLCVRVTVPTVDPRVLSALNAALEKLFGEDRGFNSGDPTELQKLALLDWVERLVQTKQIAGRPEMPEAVEKVVEAEVSGGGAGGAGATEAPGTGASSK